MPNTMTLISAVTVGAGGAATIDFTSIPSTYTDLCVNLSARSSTTEAVVLLGFNNSTSNFTSRLLYGDGSSPGSASYSSPESRAMSMTYSNQTANTFSNGTLYVPNYNSSNYKSWTSDSTQETNGTLSYFFAFAGLWSNTAAINRLTLTPIGGTFVQYSTAYLYGIKNS